MAFREKPMRRQPGKPDKKKCAPTSRGGKTVLHVNFSPDLYTLGLLRTT